MLTIPKISKKQLKVLFCGLGIIITMSLLATTPPLSHDSAGKAVVPSRAAALQAINKVGQSSARKDIQTAVSNDSTAVAGSSASNKLQGTATSNVESSSRSE